MCIHKWESRGIISHLLCHPYRAFLLQPQPQAGHRLPRRLALHLGHVAEDLALQLLQPSLHLLSLKDPRAGAPTLEEELTDPGGELGLHLGTEKRSHSGKPAGRSLVGREQGGGAGL